MKNLKRKPILCLKVNMTLYYNDLNDFLKEKWNLILLIREKVIEIRNASAVTILNRSEVILS